MPLFPPQDSLTWLLHEASVARGSKDFAALFCGQAAPLGRALPAGQLVDVLVAETQELLGRAA